MNIVLFDMKKLVGVVLFLFVYISRRLNTERFRELKLEVGRGLFIYLALPSDFFCK